MIKPDCPICNNRCSYFFGRMIDSFYHCGECKIFYDELGEPLVDTVQAQAVIDDLDRMHEEFIKECGDWLNDNQTISHNPA